MRKKQSKSEKSIKIGILIIGLILIGISLYIKNEVREGKEKIPKVQEKLEKGYKLFDFIPKFVLEPFHKTVQNKIEKGKKEIEKYEIISNIIIFVGIIVSIFAILSMRKTFFQKR